MGKGIWISIIIILILLLVIGGAFVYIISGKPKLISTTQDVTVSCADSDGKDIYRKGSNSYERVDRLDKELELGGSEDWCDYYHQKTEVRIGLIREGYCDGDTYRTDLMTCGRGYICRQGACIEGNKNSPVCFDSDGGKEIRDRGSIIGYGGTGIDECWTYVEGSNEEGGYTQDCEGENCYVYEYFCDGDQKVNEIIPCSNSCSNGRCN
jgi:hypothetical protein